MRRYVFLCLMSPIFALTLFVCRSKAQEPNLQLEAIKFTGLSRYSDAQTLAATGLHLGQIIHVSQLQAVADHLGQTGGFDNVAYRYSIHGDDLMVEFRVVESQRILPCVFDNFVWFAPEDLDRTLRARVALYDGGIPERGTTKDETTSALQALIHSNGINGTVELIASSPNIGQPVNAFEFRVDGVPMTIKTVHFPGAAGVPEPQLVSASVQLTGKDYSASETAIFVTSALLPVYHRRGYLRAKFGAPEPKVSSATSGSAPIAVDLSLPVNEGPQYTWSHVEWAGDRELTVADLENLLGMKVGEIANQDKIDAGLLAISNVYAKRGYIDAKIQTKATFDDAHRFVLYGIEINEGSQYHMGQLVFDNFPDRASSDLRKKWRIASGQVFDGLYASDFLHKTLGAKLAELGLRRPVTLTERRDTAHATVDLVFALQ
jgi:outer membrane protein assembly factor BamA